MLVPVRFFPVAILSLLGAGCVAPESGGPHGAPVPATVDGGAPSPVCADLARPEGAFLLEGAAVQGGLMRGTAPRCAKRLLLDDAEVVMAPDGRFLIAFDRDAADRAVLRAELEDGRLVERILLIQTGNWRIERVNVSRTAAVPGESFLRRRLPELERIKAARMVGARSDGWRQSFIWPVKGRISGLFGAQRIYRGEPGSYHSGVDVAAASGTPFVAPADGVVVLAAETPFTLEGYLLIIDHGMGLTSAFLHCSGLSVKQGQAVRQGQMLGAVGATGRASGPHMHWGMMWNGARIDPSLLAGPMTGR